MEQEIQNLQKQINELKMQFSVQGQGVNYGISFKNLLDGIEVVTTVPTHTPSTIYEQVKLYYSATGSKLYIYDDENNAWRSIAVTVNGSFIYGGSVNDGTAFTPFPTGWTCAKNSDGNYTVTHNLALGADAYTVVATVVSGGRQCIVSDRSTNSFDVLTFTSGGVAVISKFNFILLTP